AELEAQVKLHLVFGVDASGFFIDTVAAGEPELTVRNLHLVGEAEVGGSVGFLNVRLSKFDLMTDPNTVITLDIVEPGPDPFTGVTDNKVRLYELDDPVGLLDARATGSAAANDLTLSATFE